jgi:threonine/homoserine/homoserine lactone efflux protein
VPSAAHRPILESAPIGRPGEVTLATGLVLLAFIGILVAWVFARARRRLGLAMTGQTWLVIVAAVVLLGLAMWALSTRS